MDNRYQFYCLSSLVILFLLFTIAHGAFLFDFAFHLCYCGFVQDSVEATAEVSKTFNEKIRKYCDVTLLSLAYAGTGNVLKVFFSEPEYLDL